MCYRLLFVSCENDLGDKKMEEQGVPLIMNHYNDEFGEANHSGFSPAVLGNLFEGNFNGLSVSGAYNLLNQKNKDKTNKGVFISGGANHSKGSLDGITFAGLFNVVKNKFKGIQLSSLYNKLDIGKGFQISGIGNKSSKINGAQLSLVNIIDGLLNGAQIGVYNQSEKVNGIQIGVINKGEYSDDIMLQTGTMNYLDKASNYGTIIQIGGANIVADSYGANIFQFGAYNQIENCRIPGVNFRINKKQKEK